MSRSLPTFRFEVRSARHLDELVGSPLPLDLGGAPARASQHRDLYLDTPDDTLRQRNIVCRLRLRSNGTQVLAIRIGGRATSEETRFNSLVRSSEPFAALAERTPAGRALRALVDPSLLTVRFEVMTDRFMRTADPDWLGRPRVEIHYDSSIVRREGGSSRTYQLCVHATRGTGTTAERLSEALEQLHQLRPATAGSRDKAELLLRWNRGNGAEAEVPVTGTADDAASPRPAAGEMLNPELSLLSFQSRVLALAEDPATPLRERLRFLSIVSSNLDEFFMVRVAALKRAAEAGVESRDDHADDDLTSQAQLHAIAGSVTELTRRQASCAGECLRLLASKGLRLASWEWLEPEQREALREQCIEQIHPSLTPMAMTLSPGHPLPHLPHLSLALAVVRRDPGTRRLHLAELELPHDVPRFLEVPGAAGQLIAIEEVVRANMDLVYPSGETEEAYVFRVTRGGELALDEEGAEDLIEAVAHATSRRSSNPAVRVEVERTMPAFVRDLLIGNLRRETGDTTFGLGVDDVYEVDGLLDLRALAALPVPDAPDMEYPPFEPSRPLDGTESLLESIRERDLLAHHPFDSFSASVTRFLREAAEDPDVTTIKITLYRLGNSSAVVDALVGAARNGKKVIAFVELKARFDEGHNVGWARKLEKAGGHVISGLVGFKNHAKVALVVRRENGRLRSYAHVGTGNYNARTAKQYTDLSLFSAREELTADAADLFNALTGGSLPPLGLTRGCLVAPHQMPDALVAMIDREAANARAGRPARITAKMNGLSDSHIVRALLRAASDGVNVDLVCRSICTLRPGVPGVSDRVRVVSVVGRFLEHSRIYRFENGGDPLHYIGSADLRHRNLRRRVELLVPVMDARHRRELDRILELYLDDPRAWELGPDGEYRQRNGDGEAAQEVLMRQPRAEQPALREVGGE